jgi:hypothetical protein
MNIKHVKIFLIALACQFIAPSGGQAQASQSEQRLEVSLRMIGHQLLLNLGDSTSRVLPIEKEAGSYRIQFDTEFLFNPEDLVETVDQIVEESEIDYSFIIRVEECNTGEVAYSYQMGDKFNPAIIPCRTRPLPEACYSLLFTRLDSETRVGSLSPINPKTVKRDTFQANQRSYGLIALLIVFMIGMFLFLRKKRFQSKADPNLIALGDYQFDKRTTELLFDQQRIELTGKEADLLILLYDTVNTTIERDVILRRVWGDEGDYVGRTLDVFISKLRKKLEADPNVKIVNIRGVGYKLVLDV